MANFKIQASNMGQKDVVNVDDPWKRGQYDKARQFRLDENVSEEGDKKTVGREQKVE